MTAVGVPDVARDAAPGATLRLSLDQRTIFAGTVFGVAGVVVPPYLTAFLVRLPAGPQPQLLLPLVLVPVLATVVWLRVHRAGGDMTTDGLLEQRLLRRDRFVPRAVIASVVVVRLVDARTLGAPGQMFVKDAGGSTVMRVREAMWGAQGVDAVRSRLHVPVRVIKDPLTVAEVRAQGLVQLPWWEWSMTARGTVLAGAMWLSALALVLPLFFN